ncbi:CheR family methyltransferase [Vibrio porteresiae]|uniref:Chemotaxis protein methyltransferase n=1 Tax=Vibrio porteresiae DSM 19223 TaxID=1123496 RepID=A0ABZ0QH63_9VIBR|nr:CheR family methyltransferase [Vibrio porteresiae]WPC75052.1 CheR family methyltransferase [Vibrio porteresiae DSM 19223]
MEWAASDDTLSQADRLRVAQFVDQIAGIQLPESKKVLIETRLRKRQKALGYGSLKEYVDDVLTHRSSEFELTHFLDALTTNKTGFYREAEHFEFLVSYIVKHRMTQASPYRVWSAGCSSGEEPYTLAIELSELAGKLPHFTSEITATDISVSCLAVAKKAIYSHDKIEMMPMEKRRRHLLRAKNKTDPRIMIAPETASHVAFSEFNLKTGDYTAFKQQFSAIFCRNVMIYFSNTDRQTLTDRFAASLKEGGLLFIGHSESLMDQHNRFERLVPTIYRKRG